jgi:iron complex transport system ATP-binding protein
MIEVAELTLKRGSALIIDRLSFAVGSGRILGILGPNGVGKTTLLSALIGTLRPLRGAISVAARIGFVPQLFDLAFDYTVADVVLMGRARQIGPFGSPRTRDFEAVSEELQRLGIAALSGRRFNSLSGGQRQLAIVAQALVSECSVLVLDEPCAALDYRNQAVVIRLLDRLRAERGLTIVFSTHAPQHALDIADDVLLMSGPGQFAFGAALEMLTADRLSGLYGLPVLDARFTETGEQTFVPRFLNPTHGTIS